MKGKAWKRSQLESVAHRFRFSLHARLGNSPKRVELDRERGENLEEKRVQILYIHHHHHFQQRQSKKRLEKQKRD